RGSGRVRLVAAERLDPRDGGRSVGPAAKRHDAEPAAAESERGPGPPTPADPGRVRPRARRCRRDHAVGRQSRAPRRRPAGTFRGGRTGDPGTPVPRTGAATARGQGRNPAARTQGVIQTPVAPAAAGSRTLARSKSPISASLTA